METGSLSVWLWNELKERGLPAHVIDARHAKAGLVLQASKIDRNDARGLAQIMRTGWFKEVWVTSKAAHLLRALLASRGMLVATRRDLENQIRGLLKTFGRVLGAARRNRFEVRRRSLLTAEPGLSRLVAPLLEARRAISYCSAWARPAPRAAERLGTARAPPGRVPRPRAVCTALAKVLISFSASSRFTACSAPRRTTRPSPTPRISSARRFAIRTSPLSPTIRISVGRRLSACLASSRSIWSSVSRR